MVRTGNVDFSCKRPTSTEIRKSKYHIIRRVRFRWDPPLRKISGSALGKHCGKRRNCSSRAISSSPTMFSTQSETCIPICQYL